MIIYKKLLYLISLSFWSACSIAQQSDSVMLRKIFDEALTQHYAYEDLRYLTKRIGHRLTGSIQAEEAVQYTRKLMIEKEFDTVYLQPMQVRHWLRGDVQLCQLKSKTLGVIRLNICALGGSVGTNEKGLTGRVIQVQSLTELDSLGESVIRGNIVFFNRPMDPRFIRTFSAYGRAADQRTRGASAASKYGAIGVVVRSLTLADNYSPHTGILHYDTAHPAIPAVAISTRDADFLKESLEKDADLSLTLQLNCSEAEKVTSNNVIGEIKGSIKPKEVILVGGHLDCWDLGEGAHDDGAGCMQSIEALRILKAIGYTPRHTFRCLMFMDEEIGQAGGIAYANWSEETRQKHLAAIELDAGAATPVGFSINSNPVFFAEISQFKPLFLPYGIWYFKEGGGGVDISFLKKQDVPLIGLSTDSQRYFDYHHCELDVFERVNEREMQLGSASLAALIYLLDQK
ncbi:MAG: M28 family peptidase [Bacteroidales bacterium]